MNGRYRRSRTGLLVVVALVLAACGEPDLARQPRTVDEALPEVDTSDMWLPTQFADLRVVDPGWETRPQEANGVFLAAGEEDGVLEFSAIDSHGEVLWAAQRPRSCTGFVITTDATGRALAVLTDAATTDSALAATTATAYDLITGEGVWGPVEVPGPHQGPGLVYAATPDGYIGESEHRVALDPTTGHVAADEEHLGGARIVGEYDGTVLLAHDNALIARETIDDYERWRIPLAERGWSAASISPSVITRSAGDQYALIETSESAGVLIDLDDGTVVGDTARDTAVDRTSGARVILDVTGLDAYDRDRKPLWSLSVPPETTIAALGNVFLYLRTGDSVRVHNVLSGDVAQAYDPDGHGRIVVPLHVPTTGAAVLVDGQRYLLAAVDY